MKWTVALVSLVLVAVVALVTGHPTWEALELTWANVGWGCVWGALLFGAVQTLASIIPDEVCAGAEQEQADLKAEVGYGFIGDLGVGAIAGPIEEYVFRGVAQSALTPFVGLPLALILTNAAFGVAHSRTNLALFLVTAGLGAALGLVFALTGSLVQAMVAHSVINLTMITFGEFFDTASDRVAKNGVTNEQV
jgi:membrane protease YdiL (CAAX protease family)